MAFCFCLLLTELLCFWFAVRCVYVHYHDTQHTHAEVAVMSFPALDDSQCRHLRDMKNRTLGRLEAVPKRKFDSSRII